MKVSTKTNTGLLAMIVLAVVSGLLCRAVMTPEWWSLFQKVSIVSYVIVIVVVALINCGKDK